MRGSDDFVRKHTEFPGTKPAFSKIITDCEGNILVFPYHEFKEGRKDTKALCFDAFDSTGTFINRVLIKSADEISLFNLVSKEGHIFWTIVERKDTERVVIRYKVNSIPPK